MGLDDAAIAKPMIGVVSQKGETTPCNMTHGPQAEAAKEGVEAAGGTPREFTTISVSDGIGMNHEGMKFSLVSRELIADSIEAVVQGHAYDGLVAFGGCDKTLPGAMMGLVRCNVPGVFVYGGAALPGRFAGRDVTVLDAYEGVGAVQTGAMSEADLARAGARLQAERRRLRRPVHRQHHGDGGGGARPDGAELRDGAGRLCGAPRDREARGRDRDGHPAGAAGRCRAIWSRGAHWKTPAPSWRRPAARPTRRCTSRRSPTRPAFVSPWTMSRRCSRARR